jgi:BolA protein
MLKNIFASKFLFSQIKTLIELRLKQKLSPVKFNIIDESSGHSRGKETHFNVYIVSDEFKNKTKIDRHKLVYSSLE